MSGEREAIRVEVRRGGGVESVHDVDLAVQDADGTTIAAAGQPGVGVFTRSAVKPFQALPLVMDGAADAYHLTDEELALCCASHSGEPRHVELARSILDRIEVDASALACGPHAPFHDPSARALREAGAEPERIHNNCSGKHAGMLALARFHGWPLEGYHEAGHPVQERLLDEMARWSGVPRPDIGTGIDGCGVVTFVLPLTALARAFARLSAEGPDTPAGRIIGAMARHPYLVAGTGRLCTALMEVTDGRIVAKVGAEGVYGAAARDRGWGMALKARDGARRAAEVALLAALDTLGLLRDEEREALAEWARPPVRNTRGEIVGEVRARTALAGEGVP